MGNYVVLNSSGTAVQAPFLHPISNGKKKKKETIKKGKRVAEEREREKARKTEIVSTV